MIGRIHKSYCYKIIKIIKKEFDERIIVQIYVRIKFAIYFLTPFVDGVHKKEYPILIVLTPILFN